MSNIILKFFNYLLILIPIFLFGIYEIISSNYFLGLFLITISLVVSFILSKQNN